MKFSDIKTDQTLPTSATSIRAKINGETVTISYIEQAYAGACAIEYLDSQGNWQEI